MIPTLLLPGLLLGFVPWTWTQQRAFVAGMVALLSLAWGLLVEEPMGGGAIAAANLLVGLAVGLALHAAARILPTGRPLRART